MEQARLNGNTPRDIILYSDVDGTLVCESNQIAPVLQRQIELFISGGYGFSLATGRSMGGVRRLVRQIPVNAPMVLCNGAYVYDPETGRDWWSGIRSELVLEVLLPLMNIPSVRLYIDRSDCTLWVSHNESLSDPFVHEEDLTPQTFRGIQEVLDGGSVLKIGIKLLDTRPTAMEKVRDALTEIVAAYSSDVKWCFSNHDYAEIMTKGISKWSGIQVSQRMRGCDDALICTVGDQQNDAEMIQKADVSFAMGNAVDEIKSLAMYTIGNVKDCAIVQLLKDLQKPGADSYSQKHHRTFLASREKVRSSSLIP